MLMALLSKRTVTGIIPREELLFRGQAINIEPEEPEEEAPEHELKSWTL